MQKTHTAALELFSLYGNGPIEWEPYEAGWASEATAIICARSFEDRTFPTVILMPQISIDGKRWIDHAPSPLRIELPGDYQLPLRQFGNWIRLAGEVTGGPKDGAPVVEFDFYWMLKT